MIAARSVEYWLRDLSRSAHCCGRGLDPGGKHSVNKRRSCPLRGKAHRIGFSNSEAEIVEGYRDLKDVFEIRRLPRRTQEYVSYQLLRNMLAAHSLKLSFCVLLDARRPDLREQWYTVMSCVRPMDLRTRCKVVTWQELTTFLPLALQRFLDSKYGINSQSSSHDYECFFEPDCPFRVARFR